MEVVLVSISSPIADAIEGKVSCSKSNMKQDVFTAWEIMSDKIEVTIQCELCVISDLREMIGVDEREGVDEGAEELSIESLIGSGVELGSWLNSDSEDTRANGLIHMDMSA